MGGIPLPVIETDILGSFSKPRRRGQRERRQTKGFNEQNNGSARAFWIFVHFFAVLCKTTTWNDKVVGILENV